MSRGWVTAKVDGDGRRRSIGTSWHCYEELGRSEAALGKAANLYKGKGYDVYTERRIYRNVAQLYRARGKRAEAKRYQALADGKAAK